MTRLSIAIIAHNEEEHIPKLFDDLRTQTIFDEGGGRVETEIYVVANGCTDSTLSLALEKFKSLRFPEVVRVHPVSIPTASKTNAWNHFVHEVMPPNANFVCMMDADIRMPQRDLIQRSLETLADAAGAYVASDVSVKDYSGSSRLNAMRYLNRAFQHPPNGPTAICGQFYCARAEALRKIVLPVGLLSQDGFLRAMLLTDGLTRSEDLERIVNVRNAYHLHPAYVSVAKMFRFQKRQAIGTALNAVVYEQLNRMPARWDVRMSEIAIRNRANPNWVADLIAEKAKVSGRFVPHSYMFRMVRSVQRTGRWMNVKWMVVPFAVAIDFVVARLANAEIRALTVGSIQLHQGKFKIRD